MKTLRASGTRLQADVVIGANQYGSDVAVHLTLDRKDPEVIEALTPLDALLRRRAFALVQESNDNLEIQRRVAEKVASERERIVRTASENAKAELERGHRAELEQVRRELRIAQAQLARPEVVEG